MNILFFKFQKKSQWVIGNISSKQQSFALFFSFLWSIIVFYSFSISVFDVLDLYHKHKWYECLCITIRQKVCHLPAGGGDLSNRTSMVWFITWITFLGVTRSTKPKLRRIDPDQMKLKWTLTALKHAGEYIFENFRKTT